jgi:hypothetical protein
MRTTVTTGPSTDRAATDVVHQLEAADESLRKSFSGLPVDDVVPEVERSLDEIGVALPAETVREYAQHICDRADYQLVLP